MEENESGLVRLVGSVEHVIYANEENGYTICDVGTERDELVTVTGVLPYVGEGDSVTLYGRWVHNPKYGRQFRAESCERRLPSDSASMLRYLSSGAIKGVGPKTAQRIVDEFGEETFDVIENHGDWLANIQGINLSRARAISEEFKRQTGIRSAMMFFREYFGAASTVRIYKKWGSASVDLAKRNPYMLCEEIEGIGFERADRMAKSLGLEADNFDRVKSGVSYLLRAGASQNGHVCLPRGEAIENTARMLGVSQDAVERVLPTLIAEGRVVEDHDASGAYLYDAEQFRHEKYVARKLKLLDRVCPVTDTRNILEFIRREEAE